VKAFRIPYIIAHTETGKFTYHVVPEAGHYVHEDAPQRTANIIAEFFKRNDQNLFTLPPKVSELLARGEKV
jgi:protein phosphatase methylesterase 1